MHELSLAVALTEQVGAILEQQGASQVVSIWLEIGALSGVQRESFEFCFPLAAQGTALEGASLHIEEVEPEVRCRGCGRASRPVFPLMVCGQCGGTNVEIVAGRDFVIKSLEVR